MIRRENPATPVTLATTLIYLENLAESVAGGQGQPATLVTAGPPGPRFPGCALVGSVPAALGSGCLVEGGVCGVDRPRRRRWHHNGFLTGPAGVARTARHPHAHLPGAMSSCSVSIRRCRACSVPSNDSTRARHRSPHRAVANAKARHPDCGRARGLRPRLPSAVCSRPSSPNCS